MMRIITGKARGIRLVTLEGEATRPTSERVKEAVFSMLMGDIEDREVLDLFAGSGQMGLEAVSRGAAHATFADFSPAAIHIIEQNISKTRLGEYCTVVRADYLAFIRKSREKKFDLIFLDPPYASDFYAPSLREMLNCGLLKPSSIIVCESAAEDIFGDSELADKFNIIKHSKYSNTHITIISPKENL